MNTKNRKYLFTGIFSIAAFLLWTAALRFVDVLPIGPRASVVGFASMNQFVHNLTGVHMTLYTVTDWLGLVPSLSRLGSQFSDLPNGSEKDTLGKSTTAFSSLVVFILL